MPTEQRFDGDANAHVRVSNPTNGEVRLRVPWEQ